MSANEKTSGSLASQLIGVWRLVNFTDETDAGERSYPFGLKPEGFLIYTTDGFVSAQLMKPNRSQYQEAGSGYISYCGVFEVDETNGTITHTPSVALLPNLIGGKLVRSVTLKGDFLTLTTPRAPLANGVVGSSVLEWQRTRGICL